MSLSLRSTTELLTPITDIIQYIVNLARLSLSDPSDSIWLPVFSQCIMSTGRVEPI